MVTALVNGVLLHFLVHGDSLC